MSRIDVTVYMLRGFLTKAVPLAGANKSNRSDVFYGVFNMLLKPYTFVSRLSNIYKIVYKDRVTYKLLLICFPITQSPLWLIQSLTHMLSQNSVASVLVELWLALSSSSKMLRWGPVSLLALD